MSRIVYWILMNCYQWGSRLLCETPTKAHMELAVISNFNHRRPHGGLSSGPSDLYFNALTTRPRIHKLAFTCSSGWVSLSAFSWSLSFTSSLSSAFIENSSGCLGRTGNSTGREDGACGGGTGAGRVGCEGTGDEVSVRSFDWLSSSSLLSSSL